MELVVQAEMFRRREFRRLLTISLIFHGVAFLVLIWDPIPRRPASLPGVVTIQFVSLPADASASVPSPAAPAPAPKPRPPVPKQVVLPAKPKPIEPPKPKPEPRKPEPKPEPRKPEAKPKPEPKPEPKGYEDVLADLRRAEGSAQPAPQAAARAEAGAAAGTAGVGVPLSPEMAAWYGRVKIHLRQSWVLAPGFRLQPLATLVEVGLDAGGHLVGSPRVERSSGNPWYDDSTLRAVQKASPLPAPPAAGTYTIEFRPEDIF